jgi:phage pi2 protein 07
MVSIQDAKNVFYGNREFIKEKIPKRWHYQRKSMQTIINKKLSNTTGPED